MVSARYHARIFSEAWPGASWLLQGRSLLRLDPTLFSLLSWYSASGRGFPDIAAQTANILGYVNGESLLEDSTGCATPVCLSSL